MAKLTVTNVTSIDIPVNQYLGTLTKQSTRTFDLTAAKLEACGADLARLEAAGKITFSVSDSSTQDDRTEFLVAAKTVIIEATTARTLGATDNGATIRTTNAGATTITVPASLPVGFTCDILQDGAGAVTISAGAGATLVASAAIVAPYTVPDQGSTVTVTVVAAGRIALKNVA